jgi:Fe2+ or Zn2+ uptake regulation protein
MAEVVTGIKLVQDERFRVLLDGREARCSCGETRPSSLDLAFFSYQGVGSDVHLHCSECGMYATVHNAINPHTGRAGVTDHEFKPRPAREFDSWYCGHAGWD